MLSFEEIRNKSQKPDKRYVGTVISFDPGHTTGYAVWHVTEDKVNLMEYSQIMTWTKDDLVISAFTDLIKKHPPNDVVLESYQIYEWKADDHSWSQIPTVQVIGCIKTLCKINNIPYWSQTAQVAKQFCDDKKLESWGYWKVGMKHARDAIRHGCYWLLFHKR